MSRNEWREIVDLQPENLGGVSRLNVIALALSCVAGDD